MKRALMASVALWVAGAVCGAAQAPGRVSCWGGEGWPYLTAAPAGHDFVQVSASHEASLALRKNGTIVAWGNNIYNQLNCPAGNDFAAVAAGITFGLALRTNGTLVSWGVAPAGMTGGSNFVAIAARTHGVALRQDGRVFTWGWQQMPMPTGAQYRAISAGYDFSAAVRTDGSLEAWGDPGWLSYPEVTNCPPGTNYLAVAAGYHHVVALRNDGSLVAWGDAEYGKTQCPPGKEYMAVSANHHTSLALRRDGTIVCWGTNICGELDCPPDANFVQISAGFAHGAGIRLMPFVKITNLPVTVPASVASWVIAGTNAPAGDATNSVAGTMCWRHVGMGAWGTFPASNAWRVSVPLWTGSNRIAVYGTNVFGWEGNDTVQIERDIITTSNVLATVPYDGFVTNGLAIPFYAYTALPYLFLATNSVPEFGDAQLFPYTNLVTFSGTGTFYWTAAGYDTWFNRYWAFETNRLTIQGELRPGIRLIAPGHGAVCENAFAQELRVDYGAAGIARQTSTNAGQTWMAYQPGTPLVFPATGTYYWTARGQNEAGWWYAPRTNALTLTAQYSGSSAIFLGTPAAGSVVRTTLPVFSVVAAGTPFALTQASIDGAAFVSLAQAMSEEVEYGRHEWTARGGVLPGPVYTYAATTNVFWVVPATQALDGVWITNAAEAVALEVTELALAGTNTSGVAGDLWVRNTTRGGLPQAFSRSGEVFVTPPVALQEGENVICVSGTNALGMPVSDWVNIMQVPEGCLALWCAGGVTLLLKRRIG